MQNLTKALAMAQSEIKHAEKDGKNPHFKSDYSTLAAVWDAARIPLTKNGLAVVQTQKIDGETIISVTTLLHVSGEFITSELPLLMVKKDMQQLGSALTYARRYQLCAIAGISSDEDDGEAAVNRPSSGTQPISGPYIIPFGRYENKALTDIPVAELKSYAAFIRQDAETKGKSISDSVSSFLKRVDSL